MWHNWSKSKRWLVSLAAALAAAVLLSAGGLYYFLHIPRLRPSTGVTKRTEELSLTGKSVAVDFYLPSSTGPVPLVIIAHGFTRNRKTMAGWGNMLAREGFLVVVPDLPAWADYNRNGRALTELLAKVQTGKWIAPPNLSGHAALVGFSAGGFATLLAAAGNTNVSCWIGLDPVAMGESATQAAESLAVPCSVLRAEPAPWNADGYARRTFAALPGPAFCLAVKNATHVDAENPTSHAADWACGKSDPVRREVFGRYLLASLRAALLRDGAALRQLTAATNDPAVREVVFRKTGEFRLAP